MPPEPVVGLAGGMLPVPRPDRAGGGTEPVCLRSESVNVDRSSWIS